LHINTALASLFSHRKLPSIEEVAPVEQYTPSHYSTATEYQRQELLTLDLEMLAVMSPVGDNLTPSVDVGLLIEELRKDRMIFERQDCESPMSESSDEESS
jgi:hypothetical protein